MKAMNLSDTTHHIVNAMLTTVGGTSAIGSVLVPGDAIRAWILFGLSVLCSLCWFIINGHHLVKAIKKWFKEPYDETNLPPDNK